MTIKMKTKRFHKNLAKQIPKDIAKKIPLLSSTIKAMEETERQAEQYERDDKIKNIYSTIDQMSKDVKEIAAFHKLKEEVKNKIKKNKKIFRNEKEILDALEILFDKIWYDRHQVVKSNIKKNKKKINQEIWKEALNTEKNILKKYGKRELGPWSDFEWGMLNGKLSALRWVLKEEWDMLDS